MLTFVSVPLTHPPTGGQGQTPRVARGKGAPARGTAPAPPGSRPLRPANGHGPTDRCQVWWSKRRATRVAVLVALLFDASDFLKLVYAVQKGERQGDNG